MVRGRIIVLLSQAKVRTSWAWYWPNPLCGPGSRENPFWRCTAHQHVHARPAVGITSTERGRKASPCKPGGRAMERIFIDRNSPGDTALLISPGLDLPEHGFEPFTVPSCGLRVFYTGTIFCAPPTSTYSGSVSAGH